MMCWNCRMLNMRLFIGVVLFILFRGVSAEEPTSGIGRQHNRIKLNKDTQDIEVRMPEDRFFDSYYDNKAYQYHQSGTFEEGRNFFETIWYWLMRMLSKTRGVFKAFPVVFRIILVIISLVFLYFLITKTRMYNLFYSRDKTENIPVYELDDEPGDVDLDALFKEEYAKDNFRNAIRLLYLKLLNVLDSHHFIIYSKDKTNRDYLKELKPDTIRAEYQNAVRIYEYVWYGHFLINKNDCDRFIQDYEHLFKMVNE